MNVDAFEDAILRYDVRLAGLANGTAAALVEDIDRTLAAVEAELRRDAADADPMTRMRMQAVQRRLVELRADLADRMADRIDEATQAVTETASEAVVDSLAALGGVELLRQVLQRLAPRAETMPAEQVAALTVEVILGEGELAAVSSLQFGGRTWRAWARKLAADVTHRVGSELSKALAAGETIDDAATRLGTAGNLARNSAGALAQGAVADVGQTAQRQSFETALGGAIKGWRFTAVLDGRTSPICRALDGQVFRADDPDLPRPPRHRHCRSVLLPLLDLNDEPGGDRPVVRSTQAMRDMYPTYRRLAKERVGPAEWKRLTTAEKNAEIKAARERWQAANIGRVPASTDYATWLARQPETFQIEVLGRTRFRAFKNGLQLSAMATPARALTVRELKALYPRQTEAGR